MVPMVPPGNLKTSCSCAMWARRGLPLGAAAVLVVLQGTL